MANISVSSAQLKTGFGAPARDLSPAGPSLRCLGFTYYCPSQFTGIFGILVIISKSLSFVNSFPFEKLCIPSDVRKKKPAKAQTLAGKKEMGYFTRTMTSTEALPLVQVTVVVPLLTAVTVPPLVTEAIPGSALDQV